MTADPTTEIVPGFVSRTAVQGIPVLHAPRPGPVIGGLLFRVGRADETLATAGITHLVEHLALHGPDLRDVHHNGATDDTYTLFHAEGTEEEVVAYLNRVCAALSDLPLARLDVEREVLSTEAAGRAHGARHGLLPWRYGAQGYGLAAFEELGVGAVSEDAVRTWARDNFTRDNAVMFLTTSTVPAGLDPVLPRGARRPTPRPSRELPVTPAFVEGRDGRVVLDAIVPRSTAAQLFARVLSRALFLDLREVGGYSYTAACDYTPRDADTATITVFADALPGSQDAVVGGVIDLIARLRTGNVEQAELDAARAAAHRAFDVPDLGATMLASTALNLLVGAPVLGPDELRARIDAVTVEDLRTVAQEVWADALLQTPSGDASWAGLVHPPSWSDTATDGRRYPLIGDDDVALVVGPDGVSLTSPRGTTTVRFAACVAMTTRPDGARSLMGADGFSVTIEPALYAGLGADDLAGAVDPMVPPDVVVPLPARAPAEVPAAPSASELRSRRAADRKARRAQRRAVRASRRAPREQSRSERVVSFVTFAVVWTLFAVVRDVSEESLGTGAALFVGLLVALGVPALLLILVRRRHRG